MYMCDWMPVLWKINKQLMIIYIFVIIKEYKYIAYPWKVNSSREHITCQCGTVFKARWITNEHKLQN